MAASMIGCGKTTIPTPGVPVQVVVPPAVAGPLGALGETTVHAILIEVLAGNLGKVYIGTAGLNRGTLANVLVMLPIPTANLLPTFSISVTAAANALSLSDLWIDADNANDGVLLSVVVV